MHKFEPWIWGSLLACLLYFVCDEQGYFCSEVSRSTRFNNSFSMGFYLHLYSVSWVARQGYFRWELAFRGFLVALRSSIFNLDHVLRSILLEVGLIGPVKSIPQFSMAIFYKPCLQCNSCNNHSRDYIHSLLFEEHPIPQWLPSYYKIESIKVILEGWLIVLTLDTSFNICLCILEKWQQPFELIKKQIERSCFSLQIFNKPLIVSHIAHNLLVLLFLV